MSRGSSGEEKTLELETRIILEGQLGNCEGKNTGTAFKTGEIEGETGCKNGIGRNFFVEFL